jgi:cytochrome c553
MNIISKSTVALGLAFFAFSPVALASDLAAGKEKATAVCAACHGADGNKSVDPSYPKLAGQHEAFLLRALMDYKSGARKNAIMGAQAAQLSKKDMQNLAAYFASIQGDLDNRK